LENRKTKSGRYAVKRMGSATFAGETMIWSGLLLLAFIICHVLQFALHATPDVVVQPDAQGRMDVFTMMRESLRLVPVSAAYILSIATLFLHLFHGIPSVFQTVGLLNEKTRPVFRIVGLALSAFFLLGFGTIPLLALMGGGVFGR